MQARAAAPPGSAQAAPREVTVGLISDTHGLLRPQALDALRGSDFIVHAGDVCSAGILDELRAIAPLTVVRGNNDVGAWAHGLALNEELAVAGMRIHVVHELRHLPAALDGVDVVVFGHSHQPLVQTRDGVLFVNPGSAGPRRFSLPVCVGALRVRGGEAQARIVTLMA